MSLRSRETIGSLSVGLRDYSRHWSLFQSGLMRGKFSLVRVHGSGVYCAEQLGSQTFTAYPLKVGSHRDSKPRHRLRFFLSWFSFGSQVQVPFGFCSRGLKIVFHIRLLFLGTLYSTSIKSLNSDCLYAWSLYPSQRFIALLTIGRTKQTPTYSFGQGLQIEGHRQNLISSLCNFGHHIPFPGTVGNWGYGRLVSGTL